MDQATINPNSKKNRSAISNGFLFRRKDVDGRSAESRRFRDLVRSFSADLGNGKPTERELALIRQAAALTVQSEAMQLRIVRGEDVDPEEVVRLANVATRSLRELGIRKRRNEPHGVKAYLARQAASAQ